MRRADYRDLTGHLVMIHLADGTDVTGTVDRTGGGSVVLTQASIPAEHWEIDGELWCAATSIVWVQVV